MSYLFFGAQRRRDLPAVGRRKEIGEKLSDLPEAGRLFVNLFFIWRAKAQRRKEKTPLRLRVLPAVGRRKEIGENLSDLPEAGRLGTFVYLARRGAEALRKTSFASSRLCALTSFFSRQEGKPQRN